MKVGDEAEDAENAEILEIKTRLDDMVSTGVAEGEILQTMDLLKNRFADYGRCGRAGSGPDKVGQNGVGVGVCVFCVFAFGWMGGCLCFFSEGSCERLVWKGWCGKLL